MQHADHRIDVAWNIRLQGGWCVRQLTGDRVVEDRTERRRTQALSEVAGEDVGADDHAVIVSCDGRLHTKQ